MNSTARTRLPRVVACLACALALAAGCSRNDYAVTLRFESSDELHRARSVEVFVLPACTAVGMPGDAPAGYRAAQVLTSTEGTMRLGDVDAGAIAIYARARDALCVLYAAGCRDFTVARGGNGVLTIPVASLAMPRPACGTDETCSSGACSPGADASIDAGSSDASDASD